MKVIQEAVIGEYHFIVSDDYVAITLRGEEVVHLSREEVSDVIPWLYSKTQTSARILPEVMAIPAINWDREVAKASKEMAKSYVGGDKPLDSRKVEVSKEARTYLDAIGNPFLANDAPTSSGDGKQRIVGIEVNDLGLEAQKAGLPIIRR